MIDFVLQTKLYRPNLPHHLVPRSVLLTRLSSGLSGSLTLVSAPAGFGKTTAIATWFEQIDSAWKTAWLTLDEADNAPSRFFAHLVAAIQQVNPVIGQTATQMLDTPQLPEIRLILSALLNDLADTPHPIVLAIDEYHLMTDAVIHDGIRFLLNNTPPSFHLVLMGRADPPFSLARLRSHRLMAEIRQHDLRFAQLDATRLLNDFMQLGLTPSAVETLVTRTEGWAAGLQMAALSLQGRGDRDHFIAEFSGSNRYVFDFLAEEVLAQSPPKIRNFLLQTSVLDRFCSELCDAVLQDETQTSASIIKWLESSNHFLSPLDDARRWYRYHPLFADLLRQQLRQEMPECERELHGRASRWFEQKEIAESAIKHALSADSEQATRLITMYSRQWLAHGEIIRILTWVKRLTPAWRYQNPQLTEIYAWAQLFRENESDVEATLAHLPDDAAYAISRQVIRSSMALRRGDMGQTISLSQGALAAFEEFLADSNTSDAGERWLQMRTSATLNLAYAFQGQGNFERALTAYTEAIVLSQQVGNLFTTLYAQLGQANTLVEVGRLHQAEQLLLQGIKFGQGLPPVAPLHVTLGRLYYEWNRLDSAERYLETAAKLLKSSGIANRSEGALALTKLRLAQYLPNGIPSIVAELEQLRTVANTPHARQSLSVAFAEIALAQQAERPILEQHLRELRLFDAQSLTFARLLMATGRPQEALPMLEKLPNSQQAVRLALSLCHHALGNGLQAGALLHELLKSAEHAGYLRLFLDAGEPLRQLLSQLEDAPPYAEVILSAFPTPAVSTPFPNTQLTPRETEVLRLIAQGLTNKEIAVQLVIAPSTAKRHTVNLYNKLSVANRAEATTQAHKLGIL